MPFNGILQDSVQIFGNDTFLEAMDDQTFGMITVQEREETTHLFESGGGGGGEKERNSYYLSVFCMFFQHDYGGSTIFARLLLKSHCISVDHAFILNLLCFFII